MRLVGYALSMFIVVISLCSFLHCYHQADVSVVVVIRLFF